MIALAHFSWSYLWLVVSRFAAAAAFLFRCSILTAINFQLVYDRDAPENCKQHEDEHKAGNTHLPVS